jgi:outer membrane protein OmpA-like peptidoglycan-associated protein
MSSFVRCTKGLVVVGFLAVLALSLTSVSAVAQSDANPKWDLFAGYQWLHPGGTVPTPFGDYNNPTGFKIPDMPKGFGSALTYNFDPHWGIEFDLGHNWGNGNYETTGSMGPRFMWRTDDANYFLHSLVSLNRAGVSGLNAQSGIGAILGGGMDLPIKKWLSLRLFEVDYVWARHNYSDFASAADSDLRRPSFEGVRLRTGLVFSWGGSPELAPTAACSIQPTEVMVGEPLTATVTSSNFNPKHTVTYAWSGTGGQVTGKDTTAQIDTTNAQPGTYTVTAHATDAKLKKMNEASCSATYTVKPLPPKNPPTMSCSASPSSVQAGGSVTVTCNCTSPDGVPVSVASWNASSGSLSGSGSSATLSTSGAAPGSITINATCTDSRGLTAQSSTQATIQAPPAPVIDKVLEARLYLHSIYFPTNLPPVKKPESGLVASQQKTLIALADDFQKYLQTKPDAILVLTGHADKRGTQAFNQALSERRVARVKSFLIERGVPAGSLETVAQGFDNNLTATQVKDSVDNNPELTAGERTRIMKRMQTIIWASNRRVDVTLKNGSETQTSVRQYPFNAADSLTLIGGREADMKSNPAKPKAKMKATPKK